MNKISTGPSREKIDISELLKWQEKGTILTDDRRRRPYWFDGRFLDAQALNSEQNYFLARQSDYGRINGFGVISGLSVRAHNKKSRTIIISEGHGITPAGTQVILPQSLEVDLAATAEIQKLDASFGISNIPKASPFNRSGIYIVALRSVEYTGNKIASYPTHIDAPRTVHDGSVIEATAVSLIPYHDAGAATELEQRRSVLARQIFYDESARAQPEDVLPLAMIALDHGIIRWLDLFMVRREIAQRDRNVWGLGISPRELRAAHLRQYSIQLNEIQTKMGSNTEFAAVDHFSVLPPSGPMPASGISSSSFTHRFFPAEMDIELSIVPQDELAALIEDSMLLPPIDLALEGDAQESTSVMVLIPVERHRFRTMSQSLPSLTRELPSQLPGMIAKRKPITALNKLLMRRSSSAVIQPDLVVDQTWRSELGKLEQLWYIRRRNLHYKADVTSWSVDLVSEESAIEAEVNSAVDRLGVASRYNDLLGKGTRAGAAEMTALFASPLILNASPNLVKSVVSELEKQDTLDKAAVMKVAERYTSSGFGEGIARLEKEDETLVKDEKAMNNITAAGVMPDLDKLSRVLPADELQVLTSRIKAASATDDAAAVAEVKKIVEETASEKTTYTASPVVVKPVATNYQVLGR